jgi:NADH:ubiquinone oxidoreductase subunit 3 (subunit A)
MGEYWPILLLLALSAVIATVMVAGSWLLGPKKNTPYKDSPYECGVAPLGNARERFPIKFYLVAMLFILFDIEVVFLWSWMATYKEWVDAGDPAAAGRGGLRGCSGRRASFAARTTRARPSSGSASVIRSSGRRSAVR